MAGSKIPRVDPLCVLLFKKKVLTGGNRGNGGAARWFIHSSFKEFEVEPMSGSKIPPIGTLRYLLFKNLKEKSFHRRKQRKRRSFALVHPLFIQGI
jgi:hypothetical protein